MLDVQAVSPTDKREIVRRILASKHFHRSERLSSFLSHICELEIQERLAELNEKEIGHTVFQLPEDYDPGVDGIVRSHASRLRRKLEMYYLREGRDEGVRLVMPRGRYQPRFERMSPRAVPVPSESHEQPPQPFQDDAVATRNGSPAETLAWERMGLSVPSFYLAGTLLLILLGTVAWLFFRPRKPVKGAEAITIWPQLFTAERPTIIVPGDSGVVMWQETMRRNLSLGDYISSASPWKSSDAGPAPDRTLNALIRRRYTSIVDLSIVEKMARIAYQQQVEPVVRYARDVRPNDLKGHNVILIGSSETNPWAQMFETQMNFVLHKDQQSTVYTIENRRAQAGEPARWTSDPLTNLRTAYCKVSYLANPSGEGSVLMLEGTSMAGTECAWEFVAGKDALENFLTMAHWKGSTLPHFEILLTTSNLAGESSAGRIVAWRAR